ncbi:MAG: UDP-galactose-4-epimerase [Acidithiobacillales bacterium SM23_46]|nr:MAG: UDP-galactose-4-epimerase [Acidithiobacillales bacterium SM23_46]
MKMLVVGGAGYIGSHMVKMLSRAGNDVVTIDNLSEGYRDAVKYGQFVLGDLADRAALDALFRANHFDGVMHFASFIQAGESVIDPGKYFRNNVANTQNLLDAMVEHRVHHFIFSSTAAIYGEPQYVPIDEAHPSRPINPYGRSKLMVEEMLGDYDRAHDLKSVCLRYFNAAGADPDGELGERHDPESHLIPLVLQAASGRRDSITIFGTDYDTPDGTCIRDYIHVQDLCTAHLLALEHLSKNSRSDTFNLGNGSGFSIREVVNIAREVTGRSIVEVIGKRREGDAARLVADSTRARNELGWIPERHQLEVIIADAWRWERTQARA